MLQFNDGAKVQTIQLQIYRETKLAHYENTIFHSNTEIKKVKSYQIARNSKITTDNFKLQCYL